MLGLPAFQPNLTDYRKCIDTIEAAVKRFTAAELDTLNAKAGQAGIHAMRWEQFRQTPHGRLLATLPPVTVEPLETRTPPVPFPFVRGDGTGTPVRQCLEGIRVIELCRIIAGPTIGRLLAAHGAQVLKVTSPLLPDVPFFQVDVNTGKHTCALHLRRDDRGSVSAATVAADRARFEHLLASADVVIDGYRPGALDRLGFGTAYLQQLACRRGKGFVYVAEDCFGGSSSASSATKTSAYSTGDWSRRPGWQQIADCVTGVAHAQGRFMRPSEGDAAEPVVPPFPMSDYGTGALGCVAALLGLYRRATLGGSWEARTSLCQYDTFVLGLGPLPAHVQDRLRKTHDAAFFKLRHADSVDEVGARALRSVRRLHPHLFDSTAPTTTTTGTTAAGTVPPQDAELPQQQRQQQRQQHGIMASAYSPGYSAVVRWPREPIRIDGLRVGHSRPTRPNAFDPPSWDGWEVDEAVVATGSM